MWRKGEADIFAAPCLTPLAPYAYHVPWQNSLSSVFYISAPVFISETTNTHSTLMG